LISDFIDEAWERALRMAMTRHDLIPISITDPREEELADLGVVYVEDPETGEVAAVDTSSTSVRAAFRREVKRRRAEREGLFRKLRADFINLDTKDTDLSALVNFFRIRAKRARRG
jgi:uncharacterized protein (DUF58 family)